jgi:NADPH:quinone reductase-like Zn-dependent oxidoreductase
MKAVVYTRYGPPEVLRVAEVPKPSPGDGEVLVRVQAVSLNRSDWEGLTGKPLYARFGGPFRPLRPTLGSDIAGEVEAVGASVTRLRPGQRVYGDILERLGGLAEYVCVPERMLEPVPTGLELEVAACLPQAGAIALQGIVSIGSVQSGQRVLINGAGGGSGMYAIQLAKLHGAEVTGVDNAAKVDFMRGVGADHVIDYATTDFTRTGKTYDLILDLVAHRSVADYRRALADNGRYLYVGGSTSTLLRVLLLGPILGRRGGRRVSLLAVRQGVHRLGPLVDLCLAGKIRTFVDRRFTLAEAPDALRYLGDGLARGKVVITIG